MPVAVAAVAVTLGALGAVWAVPDDEPPAVEPGPRPRPTVAALDEIPTELLVLYRAAPGERCEGLPWPVLAGIGRVETNHHRDRRTSSAGARGPMQFMPLTWEDYGIDGDGDGVADILHPPDAVASAAHYLCRFGGDDPDRLRQALWHYNHADWYVEQVLDHAARYGALPEIGPRRPG